MVLKFTFLAFTCFFLNSLLCQDKSDYIWLSGYDYKYIHTSTRGNILNFNRKGKVDSVSLGDVIGGNNASICDKNGRLLFYFGGCSVVDSTHQIMENGDSINFGESWIRFCKNGPRTYPGSQNSMILPDPGNEKGYYLIHKTKELITEPKTHIYNELRYSYIDMSNENGRVLKKNVVIEKDTNFVTSYLSSCKHKNGVDWWIIQLKSNSNLYYKYLLTVNGISLADTQSLGTKFDAWTGTGQSTFSPDGKKWMMYGDINGSLPGKGGTLIYDFDRETGTISNMQMVEFQDSGSYVGAAISPNSRYAYLAATWDLYQIDLWADDIQSSLVHIDHYDRFKDLGFPVTFNNMQLAPDCKIYVSSSATVPHMGLISKPNEKGKACDFRQHAISFPEWIYHSSIPNYPHFRIDEEQICDSTITSIFGEAVWYRRDLEAYPNPSSGVFNVRLPDVGSGTLVVMNMDGQIVYQIEMSNIIPDGQIDISNSPDGSYFIEFYPDQSKENIYYGSKIVKVE